MTDMVSEALGYARRGWFILPCREKPGHPFIRNGETITPLEKVPYVAKGVDSATRDEDQIKAWWGKWPDAMIGVNAGKSGLFVVDIDRKYVNGLDTFTQWDINDSAGLHSITPSGGMHIVFTGNGKSSANAKTGIDTRGEGGYFIAPPSKILEGEFAGEYKAFDDWSKTPGVIPDGLMGRLFPDKTIEYVKGNFTPPDGTKKQLSRASLNFLGSGAPPGQRNSTLFKVLADFAGCGYSREQAREAVLPVCTKIGLGESELAQVLEHAYSKPRTSSIPDSIQEKIMEAGKKATSQITPEEQVVMEEALLACLLLDNSLISTINDILGFEDFRILKNRLIYRTINRLFVAGMKADYITVASEVDKETKKITLNDISKLVSQYLIDTESAITYAYIIREKACIRKVESLLDNKKKYMEAGSLVEIVTTLEKDVADIAMQGGAKSTSVLTSKQATDLVAEQTRQIINGEIEQLKIGFADYDNNIGGLYSTELVISTGRPGEGKCLGYGTKVVMFDGSLKEVQNITAGEALMGVDSKPRRVLSTTTGKSQMYTIKQNRGISYVVNGNHILSLKQSRNEGCQKNGQVINISVKDYLKLGKKSQDNLKGYKVGAEFPEKKLPSVTGINVETAGYGDYYGFMLDGDGLFLLEDFTVTHNSALSLSIMNHVSLVQNKTTALFCLEMSTHESVCRLICQLTGIPFKKVYQGKLTTEQWVLYKEAMERIANSKIFFDDGFGMTVPEIRSKIRKLADKNDIKLIVIDQLEQIKGYEGQPAYIKFDNICYDIKNFTKEFNIPIILNHQLNRNITDRRFKNPEPAMSDLNQAGEKPANQVWVICHNKDEQGNIIQSKIKILKNRNGPRIEFAVTYVGDRMLFSNPTRPEDMTVFRNNAEDSDAGESEEPYWVKGVSA